MLFEKKQIDMKWKEYKVSLIILGQMKFKKFICHISMIRDIYFLMESKNCIILPKRCKEFF